jgi:hypothetical protein
MRQHRFARLAQMQPLGNPVDKQVSDLELGQIAVGERLVLRPQSLDDLAYRAAAQQTAAIGVGKHGLDVTRRLTGRSLDLCPGCGRRTIEIGVIPRASTFAAAAPWNTL